jgi:cytochrome P450
MNTSQVERLPIPSHVPPALVVDFNVRTDPLFQGDPHAGLHSLQSRKPMFFTPHLGGHWVVTDGRVVSEIFSDTERFTAHTSLDGTTEETVQIPMGLDPPEHRKYRRLLDPGFSPRVVNGLSDSIRVLAIELIERVHAAGACEFVSEIAEPFPVTIFLRLVDLPLEDLPRFRQWAKTLFHDSDPTRSVEAIAMIAGYLGGVIQQRRAKSGTDMLSRLLEGQVDSRPLSDAELVSIMFTIFGGGLDTVLNAMSFIIRFLANNPGHRQQLLDDPSLIPRALEELMRRHSIASLFRAVKHDMEFHGVQLKAGDRLWCSTIMIAMDESLVPDSLRVDFSRPEGRNPIFGVGPHHCPGRYLARLELRVFLEEWLRRIPHFSVATQAALPVLTGPSMGLASLPLRWKP